MNFSKLLRSFVAMILLVSLAMIVTNCGGSGKSFESSSSSSSGGGGGGGHGGPLG